jgi:hypothetical protein
MNPQSKLLFMIGVFALSVTCSGQQPSDKKPLKHFAADIMKADSILSTTSHINNQKIPNSPPGPLHNVKCKGSHVNFELNKGKDDWNECSVCPLISEIIWPNEKDK